MTVKAVMILTKVTSIKILALRLYFKEKEKNQHAHALRSDVSKHTDYKTTSKEAIA